MHANLAPKPFGQRGDTPTQHLGLRYALIPKQVQLDTTIGHQRRADAALLFARPSPALLMRLLILVRRKFFPTSCRSTDRQM